MHVHDVSGLALLRLRRHGAPVTPCGAYTSSRPVTLLGTAWALVRSTDSSRLTRTPTGSPHPAAVNRRPRNPMSPARMDDSHTGSTVVSASCGTADTRPCPTAGRPPTLSPVGAT